MELTDFLTTLNGMGLSPTLVILIGFLWRQDKRLTIIETILEKK
ncbi:hypothetical protein AAIA71_15210 [Vibrio harveyi]